MDGYMRAQEGELRKTVRTNPTICVEIFERVHKGRFGSGSSTTAAAFLSSCGINLGRATTWDCCVVLEVDIEITTSVNEHYVFTATSY